MLVRVCDLTLLPVPYTVDDILLWVGIESFIWCFLSHHIVHSQWLLWMSPPLVIWSSLKDRYTLQGIFLAQENLGCVIAETIMDACFSLLRWSASTWREPFLLPHWRAWSTSSQKKGKCWPSLFLMCANWYCPSLVSPYHDSAGKVGQTFGCVLHYNSLDKAVLMQKLLNKLFLDFMIMEITG